tara:strand:- start:597 stop:698 length:102 start_codon:yes stop_codon:yes gene_type:complete
MVNANKIDVIAHFEKILVILKKSTFMDEISKPG